MKMALETALAYKRGDTNVPLLLLSPPFFPIILFGSTTLLTGMTSISLHMPLHVLSRMAVSRKKNNCFFVTD
jgi:hypothetical protein